MNNVPGVLGLHSNAEVGYFTKAAKEIWYNLIKLQPQTGKSVDSLPIFFNTRHFYVPIICIQESSSSGVSREQLIDSVADDILQRVPGLFVVSNVKEFYENNFTPSTVVLLQELERFNLLIDKIDFTLSMLRKVLGFL